MSAKEKISKTSVQVIFSCEHGVWSDAECLRCELRAARAWAQSQEERIRKLQLEIGDLKDELAMWVY